MQYIKMFVDGSPIAKNLPLGNLVDEIWKRPKKIEE